jgi:hypothetical protein
MKPVNEITLIVRIKWNIRTLETWNFLVCNWPIALSEMKPQPEDPRIRLCAAYMRILPWSWRLQFLLKSRNSAPECAVSHPTACSLSWGLHYGPWEAHSCSATQEIPRILWSPKFYYYVQKTTPQTPVLSQISPAQSPPSCFFKVLIVITCQSTSRSS